MKRILIALGVGVAMFAIVAYAASLNVGFGTAATGQGEVDKCGDITGSTYILKGWAVADGPGGDDYMYDDANPNDITKVTHVNIETSADCNQINAFIAVKDGGGSILATGFCQISGDGVQTTGPADDGLGYDEGFNSGDNVPGCTAVLDATIDVSAIEFLVVTET